MDNSFKTYTDKLAATLEQKNQAYGDSFTKSIDEDGLLVLKIRLGDKFNRISELIKNGKFKEHYLKILNSSVIEDFEEKEKIFRTEIQALADIDGISFEKALEKIESIFIDQYFQENDEKVAEQLQNAASCLMIMKFLSE